MTILFSILSIILSIILTLVVVEINKRRNRMWLTVVATETGFKFKCKGSLDEARAWGLENTLGNVYYLFEVQKGADLKALHIEHGFFRDA